MRPTSNGWPSGAAIGEAHRRYTRRINFRQNWREYLWQGRFGSFVMDESYLLAAARYMELNPVRAGLVAEAAERPWSSATAHLSGRDGRLVRVVAMRAMIDDWRGFLDSAIHEEAIHEEAIHEEAIHEEETQALREHGRSGHPLGSATFVERLEQAAGRLLGPRKPGPPAKLLKQPNSVRVSGISPLVNNQFRQDRDVFDGNT